MDEALVSYFFGGNQKDYDRVLKSSSSALLRLREVCLFYSEAHPREPQIEERKHITPMATLFLKAVIDSLPFRAGRLRTQVGLQVSIEEAVATNIEEEVTTISVRVADDSTTLKFSIPLVGPENVEKIHEITGFTDIEILAATAPPLEDLACIVELKHPNRLKPSHSQTIERGQVFGEILGLKCRSSDLPLHVGILTDLFSF